MPDLTLWQWAVLAVAAAVLAVPRLWSVAHAHMPTRAAVASTPTDEERLQAYRVVAACLTPHLAREVWLALQPAQNGENHASAPNQ